MGLGPSLHIGQIASYEEIYPIARRITLKLVRTSNLVNWQSKAKQSKAKQSKAKQSKAKQNKAKQSKAKRSEAKQSKAKVNQLTILQLIHV